MSMRNKANKKAKRAKKAKEVRKWASRSPVDKVGGSDPVECWSTADQGIESIFVFRRVAGGETVTAFFLIDYDCIGLKDAFFRVGTTRDEIMEMVDRKRRDFGIQTERITVEEARERLGAAVRWTREHPFKLPLDTERCLKILGGVDLENANTDDFGTPEGGLLYIGQMKDLASRLKGITLEELQNNPDYDFDYVAQVGGEMMGTSEEDAGEEEDESIDDAEFEEMQREMARKLSVEVTQWCAGRGMKPAARLEDAVKIILEGMTRGSMNPDKEMADEENAEAAQRDVRALLSTETDEVRAEITVATEQIGEFLSQFKEPGKMLARLMTERG